MYLLMWTLFKVVLTQILPLVPQRLEGKGLQEQSLPPQALELLTISQPRHSQWLQLAGQSLCVG